MLYIASIYISIETIVDNDFNMCKYVSMLYILAYVFIYLT